MLEEWPYRSAQANLTHSSGWKPREQSSISLMFAESTLLGGKKRSSCSTLHWRKAFPSSQHSLEPQRTFVWPAGCAGWLPGRLSPEPAAAQGHHGAGTEWGWQEKPQCWQGERLLAHRNCICVSVAQRDGEQSPGAPRSSGHPWVLPSCKDPALPQDSTESQPVPQSLSSCSWSSGRLSKAKPPEFATPGAAPSPALPALVDFGCPPHPFPSILTPNRSWTSWVPRFRLQGSPRSLPWECQAPTQGLCQLTKGVSIHGGRKKRSLKALVEPSELQGLRNEWSTHVELPYTLKDANGVYILPAIVPGASQALPCGYPLHCCHLPAHVISFGM